MRPASVLWLLLLLPTVTAAINEPLPFETTTEFSDSFDAIEAVVSAAADLDSPGAANGSLFLGADAFTFTGLNRLYWQDGNGDFQIADGSGLAVAVGQDSSVAFRHPSTYDVSFAADHAIAFFADVSTMFGDGSSDIGFGPSMVAIPVDGTTVLPNMGTLPKTTPSGQTNFNDFVADSALLLTFSDVSQLVLTQNGVVLDTLSGKSQWVGFQGTPSVGPIHADMVALPTPEGASIDFAPAGADAAAEGVSAEHLQNALSALSASQDQESQLEGIEDVTQGLAPVLNGAFVGISDLNGGSGAADLLQNVTLVRFTEMNAVRTNGAMAWAGSGALQIQNGEVAGASNLIGIFPWWSLLLWGVALVALVVRFVIKPDKKSPRWDKWNWVGLAGGFVASLLVFWLWDRETQAVWGTSLLSGDVSGVGLGVIALVQLLPLSLAGFCIGMPTRILIKSGTRFAGQGNMMRIGAIVAPFLVLLLGAPLMIDYLGALLDATS